MTGSAWAERLRGRWFIAALFLVALIVQAIVMRRQITYLDESIELYCAERVLHGQLPYRDFWSLYGPAQFYVLAAFFKLFGISALAGRFYDALIKAGIACLCFVLVERLATRRTALVVFAVSLLCLTCTTSAIYNFPIFPALLCGLISVYCLSRFLAEPSRLSFLCLAGILTGLAAIFRHDSGLYICLTVCVTLVWASRTERSTVSPAPASLFRALAAYISCVMLIFLPVLSWLLWKVPLHDLYFDLIYVPGKVYPSVRNLPLPSLRTLRPYLHPLGQSTLYALEEWIVYLPIIVCATALAALLLSRKSARQLWDAPWQRFTFGALALLDTLLWIKGWVRIGELQEMQAIVVAAALALVLISRRARMPRLVRIPAVGCGLFLSCYLCLLLWHAGTFVRWNVRDLVRPNYRESIYATCHPPAGLERTRCLVVDQPTTAAVLYVQQLTTPADPIYVGAGRHDKLVLGDIRFQFVSARTSVTKWYDLHPGVQTTLPIQQEMVESLGQQRPKVIVLNDAWDEIEEPNASRYSSGVTVLDDYIRASYIQSAAFGPYSILVPNQAAGSDSK
jgi:hypothetical protein